jgi:hypothetical protein
MKTVGSIVAILILGLVILTGSFSLGMAAGEPGVEAKIVGPAFKTLAKAYVATANLKEVRSKSVARVESMREDHFRKRYAQVYAVLNKLPVKLLIKYGVTQSLSKDQAVVLIRGLEKKDLYEIVDAVPDEVIAQEFRKTFENDDLQGSASSLMVRVKETWGDIMKKIDEISGKNAPVAR